MRRFMVIIGVLLMFAVIATYSRAQTPPTDPLPAPTTGPVVISATTQPVALKAARPTGPVDQTNCVTSECHANVKQYRVVHGPINANSCDPCHTVADAAQHTFTLAREKDKLCTFCHQVNIPATGVVHQPYKDGNCLQCHNPHGGTSNAFIRQETTRQMCASCHKDVVGNKSKVHGPVAADACMSCHKAHTAPYKNLLVAEGRELCLKCHSDMGKQLTQVAVVHKPVQEDCLKCHDVHASDFPMHIKQSPEKLCMSCHEPIKKATESGHQHSVVMTDQACLTCHTAHGGDRTKLLKGEPMALCMKCHDKAIKLPDRTVASMKAVLDPTKSKHGPIRDGNCSGCHDVHGSPVARLLTKPYPETFYQAFAVEKYELCFKCHDKQLVETEQAKGLTGFRNGVQNLHFLHVNKAERGRNCRACHATHVSSAPVHLAEKVPFGNWEMPINFKKTDTGGSCSPGCHKPYSYDRDTPATYEKTP